MLQSYGMSRVGCGHGPGEHTGDKYLYERTWVPEKSDANEAFAFTCDFSDTMRYDIAPQEEIDTSSGRRDIEVFEGGYCDAGPLLEREEEVLPDVAIYGHVPRSLMVSDRLRRAIEDAELKGFVFKKIGAALKLSESEASHDAGFYYRAVSWEENGIEPYWRVALAEDRKLPFECDRVMGIEQEGILSDDDLNYTMPLIKYDEADLRLLDDFDVAFAVSTPPDPQRRRCVIDGDAVLSRRFIEVCEFIGARGAEWYPVYKLNAAGEPLLS